MLYAIASVENMSASNILGIEDVKPEDIDVYKRNYGAHDAVKLTDVTDYYDKWALDGTYEKVCWSSRRVRSGIMNIVLFLANMLPRMHPNSST